jgi:diguanylate cyclase (GGDEF)-like protein
VIFVTALSQPEDETRALEAGAVDFISKPFNVAVVRARVRSQLTIKRQADAMRELTMTDSLTGVANRRHFNDTIDAEWRRCARAGLPLSVIMIDVDHFKLYNDHYGHQGGDVCLQQVAAAMKRCASRPQDLLARYGGEEFILLLPQEGADGAEAVARRIMDEVRKLAVPHAGSPTAPLVTVSMGWPAHAPPLEGQDPSPVIRAADTNSTAPSTRPQPLLRQPGRLAALGVLLEPRWAMKAFEVVVDVAQRQFDHAQALEMVGGRQFVGHAHAAVQLHRLLADEAAAGRRLGGRRHAAALLGIAGHARGHQHRHRTRLLRWMYMSAMRCCKAWKLPMATPNCLRVFR